MSPAAGRPRRRAGLPPTRGYRRLGAVRRAQLISTYGVGSMIAIESESFIVAGLDSWNVQEAPKIFERRLARLLGVRSFRLPPASGDQDTDGVHARRFPRWYSCPTCHALRPFRDFNSPEGKSMCDKCQEALVPSRFVVACSYGHLDDFPYWKWVHRGTEGASSGLCGGELALRSNGTTASLRSILVSCSCGVPEVSMEGAFRRGALSTLGITCRGRRPWLKDAPPEPCDQNPRTLQRGSSAAWHPIVRSAISIPPWGEGLHRIVDEHYESFRDRTDLEIAAFLEIDRTLAGTGFTAQDVVDLVKKMKQEEAEVPDKSLPRSHAYAALRREEYQRLDHGNPERERAQDQLFVCEPPNGDPHQVQQLGVARTMLVKRLREVRALESFARIEAPSEEDDPRRRAPLTHKPVDWLPAIEVVGEGVFIRLDEDRLKDWEGQAGPVARAEKIRKNHEAVLNQRSTDPKAPRAESPISARYVLLHTLAHALINEWSLDGGYPTASLRERLYADDDMAGILIYTATSDSAGSLGGIVGQGEPARLEPALLSALRRADWCSNDPLCMESEASGTDSLNLAACHACVLLPETSCETNNSFLDRAMLVGTPDGKVKGFFDLQTDL